MGLNSTRIALLVAAVIALLVGAIFLLTVFQDNPIRVDLTEGHKCEAGEANCRRVVVVEVPAPGLGTPAPTPRALTSVDFTLADGYTMDSTHVPLPACGATAFFAYAHPQNHGHLTNFELGGLNQVHALSRQSTPVPIAGQDNLVMVTTNLIDCGQVSGELVKVEP